MAAPTRARPFIFKDKEFEGKPVLFHFRRFKQNDEAALTVDWVVLTAAIVGLGGGCGGSLVNGTKNVGGTVSTELSTIGVKVADGTVLD